MTDHAEQVWAWLEQPVQQLAQSFEDDPETQWDDRVREFLGWLGLSTPDEHPVTHSFLYYLESMDDTQRREALTGAEYLVREIADAQVPEEFTDSTEASAESSTEEALRELTDQAYQWVVQQLTEEDPNFPEQLAQDPELANAIYTEAAQRIGAAAAG